MKSYLFGLALLACPVFSSLASAEEEVLPPRGGFICEAVSRGFQTRRFFGDGFSRIQASERAMRRCRVGSFNPRTCHIVYCRRHFEPAGE